MGRLRFARITLLMEMHGAISRMPMRDQGHTGGVRMESQASLITTNASVLGFCSGMAKILFSRNAFIGVTGHQGNHGEDIKELNYYLDSTPTHSYMKFLYKYPQRRYPYEGLVEENQRRSLEVSGYEIMDTDAFEDDRYWDVFVEYAKDEENPENVYIRITSYNRGPDTATLHVVPQLWFPNTWSWPLEKPPMPSLTGSVQGGDNIRCVTVRHQHLGKTHLPSPPPVGPTNDFEVDPEIDVVQPELLFTENNTNFSRSNDCWA